jgi:hypothetical protein
MHHASFPSRRASSASSLLLAFVVAGAALGPGCAFNTLGRAPDELDLKNDGSDDAQAALYRNYEVVYERGVVRRPGADPAAVAADIHVKSVDDVSSPAWSDAAFNYMSASDDAVEILAHPAVAFDEFAHSGNGELVILGLGAGTGLVGGAISWFIPTTVRDGLSETETNELMVRASGGLFAGLGLGLVVAAAYTYIVPSVTTPMAATHYRAAVRAFNDELDERIAAAGPERDDAAAAGDDDCASGKCPAAGDAPPCCCDDRGCDPAKGQCACTDGCDCPDCTAHAASAEEPATTTEAPAAPAATEAPRPVEPPAAAAPR